MPKGVNAEHIFITKDSLGITLKSRTVVKLESDLISQNDLDAGYPVDADTPDRYSKNTNFKALGGDPKTTAGKRINEQPARKPNQRKRNFSSTIIICKGSNSCKAYCNEPRKNFHPRQRNFLSLFHTNLHLSHFDPQHQRRSINLASFLAAVNCRKLLTFTKFTI